SRFSRHAGRDQGSACRFQGNPPALRSGYPGSGRASYQAAQPDGTLLCGVSDAAPAAAGYDFVGQLERPFTSMTRDRYFRTKIEPQEGEALPPGIARLGGIPKR